jgi:hypothetical protein
MMSKLIILATLVVGWAIFMLYQSNQHKKRMRQIDKEWEERIRRWRSHVSTVRRSAMVPYDEVRPKTDKLSPPKKMGKHTMR